MKAATMRQVRQVHLYVGLFLSPMILLFALSGAMQTFRLQEEKGYGGTPPAWIVWMASVHKDQALPRAKPVRRDLPDRASVAAAPKGGAPAGERTKKPSTLGLKLFVLLVAVGLALSTILGIAIALNNRATRRLSILLMAAGTVIPLILLTI